VRQIGSFFMINLCLVVIATQFSETKKRETEQMWAERQRSSSSATLASVDQLGSCYDEILRYVAHLGRVARRRVLALWRRCARRPRRRRRRRRRRRQQSADDAEHVEGAAENDVVDAAAASPRRLLRFDDQSTSDGATSRCRQDVVRLNGFPTNTIAEEPTTTMINGRLPSSSDGSASVIDKTDGNERACFCSNAAKSSAHEGIL